MHQLPQNHSQCRDFALEVLGTGVDASLPVKDHVVVEAPLAIRYAYTDTPEKLTQIVTLLRTPGNDLPLTAGFLFNEGYLTKRKQLIWLHHCHDDDAVLVVGQVHLASVRHHLTHSGCGSCSLEDIQTLYQHLHKLPETMPQFDLVQDIVEWVTSNQAAQQRLFMQTGGVHAATLFDASGKNLITCEDVGRHNALDKAIGTLWLDCQLDSAKIAWTSGRMGFELVQKCINAGIGTLIAVGAPTTLALDMAHQYGLHPFAFSKPDRINYYPAFT